MSAGAPPSSPDPRPSRVVPASDPVPMQSPPPPAPPVAAEDKKRPSPLLKKMKLLLPYAVTRVFSGMNRTCGMALVALHAVMCIIWVVTFETDPEVWTPIFRVLLYLGLASIVLVTCWDCIYYCMNYNPPQQQPAEAGAAVQLPPPPPEMDMC